jgi:cytochrome c oxidase assembly protein subunit 15
MTPPDLKTPPPETPLDVAPSYRRGPHAAALLAAAFTLPLLFVGGSVTTYRVGMAVPDWPTTFGSNMFLYDFWNAPFGVRVEHAHRLYGAAVGLATTFLMVWFLATGSRRLLKVLGVVAFLAVCVQGVLGGLRVTKTSTLLAAVHGSTGQAFFGLMVALCVLTGRDWLDGPAPTADPAHLRRRSLVTLAMIYAQAVLGAWLRHYGTTTALYAHAVFATAVWGHAAMLAWRVERHRREVPALVPSARAMALAVTIQVLLGVAAWWLLRPFDGLARPVTLYQALIRTGHQTNAALLLGASVVLTLRSFRHLSPASSAAWSPSATLPREALA